MRTKSEIQKRLDEIEIEIEKGGDYRSLETERETLEWVLGEYA